MHTKNIILIAAILICSIPSRSAGAAPDFKSGLYRIVSGSYTECCGIAGPITMQLPTTSRALVELTLDDAATQVHLNIRSEDSQIITLSLSNGIVTPNSITFGVPFEMVEPKQGGLYFKVIHSATSPGGISFEGHLVIPQDGADMITDFLYRSVEAVPVTGLAVEIRVSEIEVCWSGVKGQRYQPQYRAAVDGSSWINLGSPVTGTDSRHCITDKIPPGEPQRFYRIILIPNEIEQTSPPN